MVTRQSPSPAPKHAVSARGGELSDADLLRRHLQGDPDVFGVLFSRHKQELWAVAIRMLGDAGRAADAIKDAMILAFWRAPHFRDGDAVTTWFYRIVVNVCLDRMRRAPPRADDGHVITAMRHLVVEQQSALVLVDMLGFSVAYASNILGVPAGALLDRCARGRVRLVAELTHLQQSGLPRTAHCYGATRFCRPPVARLWPGIR